MGPTRRAMFTIEELMAIALARSRLSSTICTMNDWRPGMSNALMMPCMTLRPRTHAMVMWPVSVRAARARDCTIESAWVQRSTWRRSRRSIHTPARGAKRKLGILAGEADSAEQECGTGESIDQPTGGDPRHPGAG